MMATGEEGKIGLLTARPACCDFDSMASLYARYESIFLSDGGVINSPCGHEILVFDHHFFHLAAVVVEGCEKPTMPDHKAIITGLHEGFADYQLLHGGSRARNLPSTRITMEDPDEVWEDCPIARAKWVYVKEFDSKPYPFTVSLLTERPDENGIIVPVSSFPCNKRDVRRWRQGRLIYSRP
jgi:phage-Barnase-EndoU-ColicinE5/D-RelE like nuclease2